MVHIVLNIFCIGPKCFLFLQMFSIPPKSYPLVQLCFYWSGTVLSFLLHPELDHLKGLSGNHLASADVPQRLSRSQLQQARQDLLEAQEGLKVSFHTTPHSVKK